MTPNEGGHVVLDLNGFNLTLAHDCYLKVCGGTLEITGTGSVIGVVTTADESVDATANENHNATICVVGSKTDQANYSNLIVGKDATVEGYKCIGLTYDDNDNENCYGYGSVVTVNGILKSISAAAYVDDHMKTATGNTPVFALGKTGVVSSQTAGIYGGGYANWNLAGTVDAGVDALSFKSGNVTITGGSYTSNGDEHDPAVGPTGDAKVSGAALALISDSNNDSGLTANITGGSFVSKNSVALLECISKSNGSYGTDGKLVLTGDASTADATTTSLDSLTISGGTFTAKTSGKDAVKIEAATGNNESGQKIVQISGGMYSSKFGSGYLAAGVTDSVENTDGSYGVGKAVAEYGNDRYVNFESAYFQYKADQAITKAANQEFSGVITLLDNVAPVITMGIGETFTVNKGSYTFTATGITANPGAGKSAEIFTTEDESKTTYSCEQLVAFVTQSGITTNYKTFEAAFAALDGNGGEITLLANVAPTVAISAGKPLSVVLNGFSFTDTGVTGAEAKVVPSDAATYTYYSEFIDAYNAAKGTTKVIELLANVAPTITMAVGDKFTYKAGNFTFTDAGVTVPASTEGNTIVKTSSTVASTGNTTVRAFKACAKMELNGSTTYYDNLYGAFYAAKNYPATITLLCDSSLSITGTSLNLDGRNVTLDLNNYSIEIVGQKYILVQKGSLDITGKGTIKQSIQDFGPILVKGSTSSADENYSVLTVGKDVTLEGYSGVFINRYCNYDKKNPKNATVAYGAVVNMNGTIKTVKDASGNSGYGIYVNGSISQTEGSVPIINVGSTAKIIGGEGTNSYGMYLAGYAKTTVADGAQIAAAGTGCGIEIRAGELTVNGSATKIIGGSGKPSSVANSSDGNGSSSFNAAIAVAQHTSALPVNVTVNNGTLTGGAALYESNPEANDTDAIAKVALDVKGGKYTSTQTGGTAIYSQDCTKFIAGGTFNTQPDEGYLADGYSATYVNGAYTVAPMGHKHKYTSVVNTAATCTSAGSATYTCTGDTEDATSKGCGTSYTSPIAALGHAFSNGSITWTNGGTSAATARFTCQRDATHTQTVNAAVSKTLTINPTCTVGGTNTYTATATSSTGTTVTASKTAQDVPALGHSYGEYTITTAPTTTTTGVATAKCTRTGCTSIITKTVEKLDSTQSATTAGGTSVEVTVDEAKPTTTPDGTQVVGGVTVSDLVSTTAKEVTIPQTVTLDGAEYAVTAVDKSAFEGNTTVTSVTLPDTVTSIPEGLFEGCTSLESVTLPETLKEIPSNTFSGTAITSITIPATVTTIGDGAFAGTSLESVDVSSAKSIGSDTFKDCSSLKTVDVSSAETIGSEAFKGCTALESVDVSSATTIGSDTFAGCTALESVNVSSATSIGNDAFTGCSSLKSVDVSSAETIGSNTFKDCSALESVEVKSATTIGSDAFSGCSKLTTIDASAATSIGNGAFAGCSSLESVNVSAATSIGSGTFSGCNALKSVDVSSAKSIGSSAFKGCSTLKTIDVSAAKTIDSSAFSGCSKLSKVSATKVTTVESSAFKNCSSLTTIKLTNVKTIGANAFSGASKLKTLTTGSSLKGIGAKALSGASKVKTLTITSKKLTKASIKNALKGSSVSTIKVKVSGSKKTKAKYVAAYAKIFSKSNCGKKVTVK